MTILLWVLAGITIAAIVLVILWQHFQPSVNFYKFIYYHAGGRPFTHVMRSLWRQAEILMQVIWFWTGVAIGITFGWQMALIATLIYLYGFVNGHYFWGTDDERPSLFKKRKAQVTITQGTG